MYGNQPFRLVFYEVGVVWVFFSRIYVCVFIEILMY